MEYVVRELGGLMVLIYFFLVVGIPILFPILIWLNLRRCASALEGILEILEDSVPGLTASPIPPPLSKVAQLKKSYET